MSQKNAEVVWLDWVDNTSTRKYAFCAPKDSSNRSEYHGMSR